MEENREAVHSANTLAFYLLSAAFTGQFVIARLTERSVSLFRARPLAEAPVVKAETEERGVPLSICLNSIIA